MKPVQPSSAEAAPRANADLWDTFQARRRAACLEAIAAPAASGWEARLAQKAKSLDIIALTGAIRRSQWPIPWVNSQRKCALLMREWCDRGLDPEAPFLR